MRHFAYQKQKQFYNGITQKEIHEPKTEVNSLQPWTSRGIAGRGVLVDFASRAKRKGKTFNTFSQFAITLEEVKSIVEEEKLVFQPGDILFLRTDYVEAYRSATAEQKQDIARNRGWIGLGQGKETTEWLRENQFAAVADDNPGFDCRPAADDVQAWHLHPILLAGWGTPIGELFDLDRLAELCEKRQKWSFFLTSAPLNYTGAVASPPDAIAIL